MGRYTDYTRTWLDRRFRRTTDGVYFAHQPIWGLREEPSERGHPKNLARTFRILQEISMLDAESVLDVGGAEGVVAHFATAFLGVPGFSADLSLEACRRAFDLFGVDSAAISSHRLPFADDAFDVVVCSEVLEHVEFPAETLAELDRVARRAVIVTTMEIEHDRDAIAKYIFQRCGFPHSERNLFHPEDLRSVFGANTRVEPQFARGPFRGKVEPEPVVAWMLHDIQSADFFPDSMGAIVVHLKDPAARRSAPSLAAQELAERVVGFGIAKTDIADRERADPLAGLGRRLACPACRLPLALADTALRCGRCDRAYPVVGGTADLTIELDPDVEATATELAQRWQGDPQRATTFERMRAQLTEPEDGGRRRWDFTRSEDRRGWLANEVMAPRGESFVFDSQGDDPWILGPGLYRDVRGIAGIEVTMRIHNPDYGVNEGLGELYWLGEDDTSFEPRRSITFPLVNDGQPHSYRIPVADHPEWQDAKTVICLRIDPANGPCEIELLAVELVPAA